MKRLKVEDMGDEVQGIQLKGDRRSPEPTHVRIMFPGGDVDVVRTSDDQYWIHVRVNRKDSPGLGFIEGTVEGRLVDARLDVTGKHASETDAGDFKDPGLYHLAVRIEPQR